MNENKISNKVAKIRQPKIPVRIIITPHYCGTKKMGDIFENVIAEQIQKNIKKS
jgi:hypothetical protein